MVQAASNNTTQIATTPAMAPVAAPAGSGHSLKDLWPTIAVYLPPPDHHTVSLTCHSARSAIFQCIVSSPCVQLSGYIRSGSITLAFLLLNQSRTPANLITEYWGEDECLSKILTECGIKPRPLTVISEYFDSRGLLKSILIDNYVGTKLSASRISSDNRLFAVGREGTFVRTFTDDDIIEAFLEAAAGGHLGMMQYLLDHFPNRLIDYHFGQALREAAKNGHLGIMQYLLDRFPARLTDDYFGEAFCDAAKYGHQDIMQYLLDRFPARLTDDAFGEAFCDAAKYGQQGIMEWILRNFPANCLPADTLGQAFIDASCKGNLKTMEWLINNCSKHLTRRDFGQAFTMAAASNRQELTQWFIDTFPTYLIDDDFDTALMDAGTRGGQNILVWLIRTFSARITNAAFAYTLREAALHGHQQIVEFLLQPEWADRLTIGDILLARSSANSNCQRTIVAQINQLLAARFHITPLNGDQIEAIYNASNIATYHGASRIAELLNRVLKVTI